MADSEFHLEVKIDIVRNGAIMTVRYPESGTRAGETVQRVYRDVVELQNVIEDLWYETVQILDSD